MLLVLGVWVAALFPALGWDATRGFPGEGPSSSVVPGSWDLDLAEAEVDFDAAAEIEAEAVGAGVGFLEGFGDVGGADLEREEDDLERLAASAAE